MHPAGWRVGVETAPSGLVSDGMYGIVCICKQGTFTHASTLVRRGLGVGTTGGLAPVLPCGFGWKIAYDSISLLLSVMYGRYPVRLAALPARPGCLPCANPCNSL